MMRVLLLVVVACHVEGRSPGAAAASRTGAVPWIIGGREAPVGRFPWTLSVEFNGSLGWLHMCGGVLIKATYALTGAKCVKDATPDQLRAWAGLLDRTDTSGAQLLPVSSMKVHEEYSEIIAGLPNDIAILEFSTPALTDRVDIDLAILPTNEGNDFANNGCFINGWGKYSDLDQLAPKLLYAEIMTVSNQQCLGMIDGVQNADILATHVCVHSASLDTGACNGDSGSSLSCYPSETDHSVEYVVGIMSWTVVTENHCNTYYPSVYTRLSKYLDWITANTP